MIQPMLNVALLNAVERLLQAHDILRAVAEDQTCPPNVAQALHDEADGLDDTVATIRRLIVQT